MKTINLGSGVTLTVPQKPVADDGEFVEVAVWMVSDHRKWSANTVDSFNTSLYADHAKLRIPIALLEGRAVPEPAKAEPDWRGFVDISCIAPDKWFVRAWWMSNRLDLDGDGHWIDDSYYFATRAEAEAALARAKHPGESA